VTEAALSRLADEPTPPPLVAAPEPTDAGSDQAGAAQAPGPDTDEGERATGP
jgi:hypothetical protein